MAAKPNPLITPFVPQTKPAMNVSADAFYHSQFLNVMKTINTINTVIIDIQKRLAALEPK